MADRPFGQLHCGLHVGWWRCHRDAAAPDPSAARPPHRHSDGADELTGPALGIVTADGANHALDRHPHRRLTVGLGLVVTRDGGVPLVWHAHPANRPDVATHREIYGTHQRVVLTPSPTLRAAG
ncbi:MAG: hypothetical protein ACRDSZ_16325 [Pseudonocardiaceae bacterium]